MQALDRMVRAHTLRNPLSKSPKDSHFPCSHVLSPSPALVSVAAVLVLASACADLTECHHHIYCFIVNTGIVVLSLFGVLGAYKNDGKLLGWFLLLILAFTGFEIGFVIWSARDGSGRTQTWRMGEISSYSLSACNMT
jgi:hypothetical protein